MILRTDWVFGVLTIKHDLRLRGCAVPGNLFGLALSSRVKAENDSIMSFWFQLGGWLVVALNTLCLFRLGIIPMVFFWKNYALYRKFFWVSVIMTFIFLFSETMLISIMLG